MLRDDFLRSTVDFAPALYDVSFGFLYDVNSAGNMQLSLHAPR